MSYVALAAFLLLVLAPILIPAVITAAHAVAHWREIRRSLRLPRRAAARTELELGTKADVLRSAGIHANSEHARTIPLLETANQ
jgi:hypothetical protein